MISPQFIYDFVIGKNVRTPMFNILGVMYGNPLATLPKRNFARFLVMNFILYYLIIRTVYQGGIYKILKYRQRKPELSSIDEIMEKGYDFYLYETFASRAQDMKFYSRRKVFPNDDIEIYRQKTLDPNFKGVVVNYINQILYLNEQNYKNFSYKLCKEALMTNNFVFYFRKNHYLVDEVSSLIDLMLMSGICKHIRRRYMNDIFLSIDLEDRRPKPLEMKYFMGAFRFLFMFNSIAFVVFMIEIFMNLKRRYLFRLSRIFFNKCKRFQIFPSKECKHMDYLE